MNETNKALPYSYYRQHHRPRMISHSIGMVVPSLQIKAESIDMSSLIPLLTPEQFKTIIK